MRLRNFFVLAFLLGCSHTSEKNRWANYQILIRCHVFNMDGELLRQLPGRACYLNQDGSYVSFLRKNKHVVKYDSKMEPLWLYHAHAHHQLMKNSEGNYLFLSSEFAYHKGKNTRFDAFVMLDKDNGKELGKISVINYQDRVVNHPYFPLEDLPKFDWDEYNKNKAEVEYSHYNSIHEVPVSITIPGFPKIKKGDYITGATYEAPILFFDSKLSTLKASLVIPDVHKLHDVQVLKNGNLLLYINEFKQGSPHFGKSMIAEYNIPKKQLIKIYDDFYAETTGGVQKMDDNNYFFSRHDKTGAYATIVSPKGEVLKKITFSFFKNSPHIQEARIGDFSKNLELNKGP